MTAQQQLEQLFAPDIRVKIDADYRIRAFELLTQAGAAAYLNRSHSAILGIDLDAIQAQMQGVTFEIVQ